MLQRISMAAAIAVALISAPAYADDPMYGGTLIAGIDHQPRSLDPIMGDAITGDRRVFNAMFEPLLRSAPDGTFEPVLATSWEMAEDGSSITFQLREGVTFHDGTPFNADAVVFNFERVMDPENNSPRQGDLANVESVEALDAMAVRLNLRGPNATTLSYLTAEGGYIISPTAAETFGEELDRHPVGTGPFRFVDWPGGERVNMVRFENYWGRDELGNQLPYLDELVIRTFRQTSVMVLELEADSVQLGVNVPIREADRLEEAGHHSAVVSPYAAYLMLYANVTQEPFDNQLVRQALSYAVDRDQIALVAGGKRGFVYPTVLTPYDAMFDEAVKGPGYDPDESLRLLAEAGFDRVTFTLSVINREPDARVSQLIQSQARAAGFDIELQIADRQTVVDMLRNTYAHQVALARAGTPQLDADQNFFPYLSSLDAPQNYSRQDDATLHDLIVATRVEVDPVKRRELFSELQRYLLEQSYVIYLAGYPFLSVASDSVHGLRLDKVGVWVFDEIWLAPSTD